jgi:hypothetical protein
MGKCIVVGRVIQFLLACLATLIFCLVNAASANANTNNAPWCPAAVIGPASSGALPSTPPSGVVFNDAMAGDAGVYVAGLRASLSQAVGEYASALSDLNVARGVASADPSGVSGQHVESLRSDLRYAVIEAMRDAASAGPAEIAVRSAVVDTLLARINAYERVYGRGPGEPTSAYNVLNSEAIESAIANLERARTALAFELAVSPVGHLSPALELRLREISATLTDLEAEQTRRAQMPGANPRLLTIESSDSREAATSKSSAIRRVDSIEGIADTFGRKLLAQVAMRSADNPNDANMAALRRKLFGLIGPDKADVANDIADSFRGRRFPDGPNPSAGGGQGPTGPGSAPRSGGPTDPFLGLRAAAFDELEARRSGDLGRLARAIAQFDANQNWLAAGLPVSWRRSVIGYAVLSDNDLRILESEYQTWVKDIATEASVHSSAIREQDLIAARVRLAQLREILAIRAGTGWWQGDGPSARGPPAGAEAIALVWRANSQSVAARVAQVVAPLIEAQSETAERASAVGLRQPPARTIAELRFKELQARAAILNRVSEQFDTQLAQLLASQARPDFDLRRSLASGRSDLADAQAAFNSAREQLVESFPDIARTLPAFNPTNQTSPVRRPSATLALERAVAAAELLETSLNARVRLPISVVDETKPTGSHDARVILGGLGQAATSESASFERLFPRADWTQSLLQLQSNVARMPGGIILAPRFLQGDSPRVRGAYRDPSGAIVIAMGGLLYRSNLTATDAEWRSAVAFAIDRRLIAIDIRGLKHSDVDWVIANALPDAFETLARAERRQLADELRSMSAINVHPAFENGPWAESLVAADTLIFNVLPHEVTQGVGGFSFAGFDLRPLRQAFHADIARTASQTAAGMKSVISAQSASLNCVQGQAEVKVNFSYSVYADEQLMRAVSAWLDAHDQGLRNGSFGLRETARLASLVAILQSPDALSATLRGLNITEGLSEPSITPKFLCSERRFGLGCELTVLRTVQYGENQ